MTVKLTEPQVREIKRCLAAGIAGYRLAERFGVSKQTISTIKKGKVWKSVPWPNGKRPSNAQKGGQTRRRQSSTANDTRERENGDSGASEQIAECDYERFMALCGEWYDDWDAFLEWMKERDD